MGCAASKDKSNKTDINVVYNVLQTNMGEIEVISQISTGKVVFRKNMTEKEFLLFKDENKRQERIYPIYKSLLI